MDLREMEKLIGSFCCVIIEQKVLRDSMPAHNGILSLWSEIRITSRSGTHFDSISAVIPDRAISDDAQDAVHNGGSRRLIVRSRQNRH
jgi:hypothetical protein